MKTLGKDKLREQQLLAGTMYACKILNEVVIPTCKELSFTIDIHDTETLDRYMRDLPALHDDYITKMTEGANNPALVTVLKKSAEELWAQASGMHELKNTYIISDIPDDVMEFVTLTGSDIFTFHARPDNPAIAKASVIEATQEDIDKMEELKEVCEALNKCFNGNAQLFMLYIYIESGRFFPRTNTTNYKPLIYGK